MLQSGLKVDVVRLIDHGGSVVDTFDLVVNKFDRSPRVMVPIAEQAGTAGTGFSYTVSAGTFADDKPMTYPAKLADGSPLPGWLVFDATTRTFSGTPPAGQAGSFDI